MHLIVKAGVLLLTLTALSISAQAGRLETSVIGAPPEGVGEASAPMKRIDAPLAGERSFRAGEVMINLPSSLSLEAIDALARRHRLTPLESRSIGLLGRTAHRWGIADERSVPDVILALERDSGIDAQPNNIYILQ